MGIHDGHREKMRRRFLETGLEGFADHEALELLLYYAIPRRDTNPIAHALMERYDSLSGVLNAPVEDLEKVEGIGESAAILLSLVSRLSRKARIADASQETILNSSERAGAYLLERFAGERRELVFLLCLDRKGRLLACKRLAEGDVASADLNIRKVVEMALLARQKGIRTVGVVNMAYAGQVGSRDPSGKLLQEVCDVVIDTCGCYGDACIQMEGMAQKVAPASTPISTFIANILLIETCQRLLERGVEPPVFQSANVDGGKEYNAELLRRWAPSIHYMQ